MISIPHPSEKGIFVSAIALGAMTACAPLENNRGVVVEVDSSDVTLVEPNVPPLSQNDRKGLTSAYNEHNALPRGINCRVSFGDYRIAHTSADVQVFGGRKITVNAEILREQYNEAYSSTVSGAGILNSLDTQGGATDSAKAWRKGPQGVEGFNVNLPNTSVDVTFELTDAKASDTVLIDIGDNEFKRYAVSADADSRGVRTVTVQTDGSDYISGVTLVPDNASVAVHAVYGNTMTGFCEPALFGSVPSLPTPKDPVTPPKGTCITCPTNRGTSGNQNTSFDRSTDTGVAVTGGNDSTERSEERGDVGATRDREAREQSQETQQQDTKSQDQNSGQTRDSGTGTQGQGNSTGTEGGTGRSTGRTSSLSPFFNSIEGNALKVVVANDQFYTWEPNVA